MSGRGKKVRSQRTLFSAYEYFKVCSLVISQHEQVYNM